MTALKSLTFTTLPNQPSIRRLTGVPRSSRASKRKALLRDPGYMCVVRAWGKNDSGEKAMVDKKQRVLPWWSAQPSGSCVFFVRAGWKPIEFEKGKAAIAVPSIDKLPSVIETVIAAVRAGELDEQLAHASAQATPKKAKGNSAPCSGVV